MYGSHSTSTVPRLDLLLGLDLDLGAVHDRIALALAAPLVDDDDLAVAVGGDQVAVAVHDRAQVVELHDARVLGLVLGGLDDAAGGAADVEGPHRELRARLADRLGGDDADRLAQLGQAAGAEVAAVAHARRCRAWCRRSGRSGCAPARGRTSSIFWASSSVISVLAWTMISLRERIAHVLGRRRGRGCGRAATG